MLLGEKLRSDERLNTVNRDLANLKTISGLVK